MVGLSNISLSFINNDLLFDSHEGVVAAFDARNDYEWHSTCIYHRLDSVLAAVLPSLQMLYSTSYGFK
jgi:hypothetical protein